MGAFRRRLEHWHIFNCGNFEYPSDELLARAHCLIIPGSRFSAYDTSHDWIVQQQRFVKHIYKQFPYLKILGVCFGEQILAESLGGKVEQVNNYLKKHWYHFLLLNILYLKNIFFW